MPLAMALANRSSPLVVAIAAVLFLAGRCVEDAGAVPRRLVPPLARPIGLAALAFLAWCALTLAWTPFPALSLRMAGEFLPTLVAAYLLVRLAPGRIPAFAAPLAAAMVVLAGLTIAVGLATGLPLQRALGQRVAEFVYNRPALTLAVVAGPLALALWRQGRRVLALVALAFAALGILRSVSGAAAMGLIAGGAMFALARLVPGRLAVGVAGLSLGLAVALAPVEGDLLDRFMPEAAHERLVHSSSRARVAIARSFGAAVAADPWVGAGFGTSARFAETPVAQRLDPEMRTLLAVGHPHNAFLQVWAELGVVGAVLVAAVSMLMLAPVAGSDPAERATALALIAAAAAIALVEHNTWAAWWTAGLGAAITWLRDAGHRTAQAPLPRPSAAPDRTPS
ncbi:O-antigen ligase family protein [Methylobacterium sp. E-041]|uniref:O-antigen ligase family protein n=1 Tax=Methylobacterium sp. E-041 TaxID=2836573 RepID=UPI001FB8C2F5|nr:O-antigen ligase family protein [Methylobacterium sp. E-041]MCJ2104798.1 O-antigen ligase family protein [Methylobacterium sp. E-041]